MNSSLAKPPETCTWKTTMLSDIIFPQAGSTNPKTEMTRRRK